MVSNILVNSGSIDLTAPNRCQAITWANVNLSTTFKSTVQQNCSQNDIEENWVISKINWGLKLLTIVVYYPQENKWNQVRKFHLLQNLCM